MGNNSVNWILLIILVWARQSVQYSCDNANNCHCHPEPPHEYVLDCPKDFAPTFFIRIKSEDYASVKCSRMSSWRNFKLNSTAEIEDVGGVSFEQCLLPDSTLHDITQRIGIQPKQRLKFESYKNLSSTLERRYLSGFPTVQHLSLASNSLTKLPADLLMDLPELIVLELRQNNVILPSQFFNSVPKLQWLGLGDNKLIHIDPMLFQSITKLSSLGLWGNQLTDIEKNTFDNLTALITLDISRNNLTTLDPEVFRPLTNLTTLHISQNFFSSLPEDLLSKNYNLTTFRFYYNKGNMSTLPSRFFSNLPKLQNVYLNRVKLEVLPEDIFWGSSSLTHLDLCGNFLTTLPRSIFKQTKNIKILDLSINRLSNLPDGIFEALSNLEKLKLQNNSLTFISDNLFSSLSGLKELNLEHNKLRSIAAFSFTHLLALEVAQLSHNQLTLTANYSMQTGFGDQSPFYRCVQLRELYLAHNNITVFFSDWTVMLGNLRNLDLKYNQLSVIETADFQFLSRDINVDISHNSINQINLESLELVVTVQDETYMSKNVIVSIEENPIVCDCDVFNFIKYLNGDMHPDVQKVVHIIPGNLKCVGPEWMQDILVSDLKSKNLLCANSNCPNGCTCWLRKYDDTIIADCSYRNLTTGPEKIISKETDKVELDLTGNLLTEVPFIDQSGYGNLTKLLLSHNQISSILPDNIPLTLEVIELHNNNLVRLGNAVLERLRKSTVLKNLTLYANSWKCDCEARDFLSFIQSKFNKITNLQNVTCGNDMQPLSKLTMNDLCPVSTKMIVGISVGIALLGLLIGILAALYYRYQAEIKIWLYAHQLCLWFVTEEELDKDKIYDAFISYSHEDEDFIVDKLVPKLEEGPKPFKLCLHYRDWVAGEWIPTQIARSVEDSRRTIVILSSNFLKSIWGRMEFRAAHSQALSEGRARVIVILYGDLGPTDELDSELKAYLSMNTYVEWGDPWFWDKLRYALPHRSKEKHNNARKVFESHQPHIQINGDKNILIHSSTVPATPPAVTTPPADMLKTFTSNGSLSKEVLITDCLKNGMMNCNNSDLNIDHTPKQNECDNNMINGQCTPV